MGRQKTTEEFIDQANTVHGDTYDYSKVEYVDSNTKVQIICRKHGEFLQTPNDHLMGAGCPQCGLETQIQKQCGRVLPPTVHLRSLPSM